MSKSSYRFDGSSFTGQKYAYVGPSSAPCRKVNPLGDIEMISKDEKWKLSGNNSYIYDEFPILAYRGVSYINFSHFLENSEHEFVNIFGSNYPIVGSHTYTAPTISGYDGYHQRIDINFQTGIFIYIYASEFIDPEVIPICFQNLYPNKTFDWATYFDLGKFELDFNSSILPSYDETRFNSYIWGSPVEYEYLDITMDSAYPGRFILSNNSSYAQKYNIPDKTLEVELLAPPDEYITLQASLDRVMRIAFSNSQSCDINWNISLDPQFRYLSSNETEVTIGVNNLTPVYSTYSIEELCALCKLYTY
jgi:hypothetical protein